MTTAVVWFRNDLRLGDNPAWAAATAAADLVVPLFVLDQVPLRWAGERRRDLLLCHLAALDADLATRGGRLLIRRGHPAQVVAETADAFGADGVHVDDDMTPYARRRDASVSRRVPLAVHHGRTVHPVGSVTTGSGAPFKVFTPFHRAWESRPWDPWPDEGPGVPTADPGEGLPPVPVPVMEPGEVGATARLDAFLALVDDYQETRDRPDLDATSRLSADLHFGTVSPRTVAAAVGDGSPGRRAFVRQLAWREFYAQILAAVPQTLDRALRPGYDRIRWREAPDDLEAWQQGRTGYPIVDAGMRQLLAEGWMHNRVRMIAASFLVKDLLVDWRHGERWFRHHLVDADVSQNVGNWQWVAGTGADAAPYFRIFNPVVQSRRFDPDGVYLRRWIPELASIEGDLIHTPWEAGPVVLAASGYPEPIVDHAAARERTLAAYRTATGA